MFSLQYGFQDFILRTDNKAIKDYWQREETLSDGVD